MEFTLGRCPFAEVAAADPGTICQLHLGLAEGLTEGLGQLTVERLVPKDPHRAGCRLIIQRYPEQAKIQVWPQPAGTDSR